MPRRRGSREVRTRRWIFGACSSLALALLVSSLTIPASGSDLLGNLGAELLGIFVTVAVVERMLDQLSQREHAESIAWQHLQELDHAVWIWLGGGIEFDLDELRALLHRVESNDPLAGFTQNLLLRLANRAQVTLTNSQLISQEPRLAAALTELSGLSSVRDGRGRVDESSSIARRLLRASDLLAELVGLDTMEREPLRPTYELDSAVTMQRWRYFGRDPAREELLDTPDPIESGDYAPTSSQDW